MATDSERIALMFNDIAPTYDKLNHVLSLNVDKRWRRKAVKCVKKAIANIENPLLLDVACGTADSTIALAQISDNVRVNGIDIADGMLKIGEEKVYKIGLNDRITFSNSCAKLQ